MINLFVDTSYKSLFIALLKDSNLIDKIQIMSEFNFSETMIPSLNNLLEKNNIKIKDIGKVFIVVGPGSFTGIRIGLTACKTLCYVQNIPIVPISSLEFMATTNVNTKYIIPVIDARHSKVFAGVYSSNGENIKKDCYTSISEIISGISDYTFVTYDKDLLEESIIPAYDVQKIVSMHLDDPGVNVHSLKPNYLKLTEAEEKLK